MIPAGPSLPPLPQPVPQGKGEHRVRPFSPPPLAGGGGGGGASTASDRPAGMRLNAIERGAGPPLVLLHGLFGSARNFGAVQRRLAEHWRVLALDLRNHGASPHAPGMDYGAQAADVRETLAALGALPAAL